MAGPNVLVIHGVSHREVDRFHDMIEPMATALRTTVGDGVTPVFWGDLAPPADLDFQSIPRREDDTVLGRGPEELTSHAPSITNDQLLEIAGAPKDRDLASDGLADRTLEVVRAKTGLEVPTETAAVVREAIRGATASGAILATQVDLEEALAQVVLLAPPTGESTLEFGAFDAVRDGLSTVMRVFDREAGRLVGGAIERLLRDQQPALSRAIATNLGDILSYEKDGSRIRGRLDAAYDTARTRGSAVDLVAHSLGALIAIEWLLGASVERPDGPPTQPDARRIRTFVSFGTQVSLFSELHGLEGAAGVVSSQEPPAMLEARVERWVNVWHQLDPLAFVMHRSLQLLAGGEARSVEDLRLELAGLPSRASELSFHSSYWTDPRFLSWLAGEMT